MAAKPEYRDRPDVEVALLDALVDRGDEGMTVLELRAAVDANIDAVEEALSALKADSLITVESEERVRGVPARPRRSRSRRPDRGRLGHPRRRRPRPARTVATRCVREREN